MENDSFKWQEGISIEDENVLKFLITEMRREKGMNEEQVMAFFYMEKDAIGSDLGIKRLILEVIDEVFLQ